MASLCAGKLSIAIWLGGAIALSAGMRAAVLTGSVRDSTGRAVEQARVVVYHAGLPGGFLTAVCRTCYPDCGKQALTDGSGEFTIAGLSPDLAFDLLVVRRGYVPAFVVNVDPAKRPAPEIVLTVRQPAADPWQEVRGRVIDAHGNAVADALIRPAAILVPGVAHPIARYEPSEGLEPLAVTDANGEFEIAYARPFLKMLLSLEAGGQPRRMVALPAGPERHTIPLAGTATVRGRLTDRGKAVSAAISLAPRGPSYWGGPDLRAFGNTYSSMSTLVRDDGTFSIPNVPAPGEWYVLATMQSLRGRGTVEPVPCATRYDGEVIDIGELQLDYPAYRLRGRVVLSDGNEVPDGAIIITRAEPASDGVWVPLSRGGRFEFAGLPAGRFTLMPAVRGYMLPDAISAVIAIGGDVDDFVLTLVPRSEIAAGKVCPAR